MKRERGFGTVALVLGGAVVLLVVATLILTKDSEPSDSMMESDAMMEANGSMMEEDGAMMEENSMMEEGAMKEEGSMMESDGAMMEEAEAMMETSGVYEAYAPEKLAMAASGDVVLFFRASWCPTCRALDTDIRANLSDIPAGLTILDVNYDDATALKQRYGVTYQHTFVQVASDGTQIAKWTGSPTLAALVGNVK